jgi:hypothetical protein
MLKARRSRVQFPIRSLISFSSNLPNPSSHTKALGLTQLLTEMSTRDLFGGVNCKADNLTTMCEPIV